MSLPCLKPFSCFLACKLHCKFLKCVFTLLISWPSLSVPLLECNTSSCTSYASKGKICISNSRKPRVLVYRTSGSDILTESNGHIRVRRFPKLSCTLSLCLSLTSTPLQSSGLSLCISSFKNFPDHPRWNETQAPRTPVLRVSSYKCSSHCSVIACLLICQWIHHSEWMVFPLLEVGMMPYYCLYVPGAHHLAQLYVLPEPKTGQWNYTLFMFFPLPPTAIILW